MELSKRERFWLAPVVVLAVIVMRLAARFIDPLDDFTQVYVALVAMAVLLAVSYVRDRRTAKT